MVSFEVLWFWQEHGKCNSLYSVNREMPKKFYFNWTLRALTGQCGVILTCLKSFGFAWIILLVEVEKQCHWCCWSTSCRLAVCLLLPSGSILWPLQKLEETSCFASPVFSKISLMLLVVQKYQNLPNLIKWNFKNNPKEECIPRGDKKQPYSYLV